MKYTTGGIVEYNNQHIVIVDKISINTKETIWYIIGVNENNNLITFLYDIENNCTQTVEKINLNPIVEHLHNNSVINKNTFKFIRELVYVLAADIKDSNCKEYNEALIRTVQELNNLKKYY